MADLEPDDPEAVVTAAPVWTGLPVACPACMRMGPPVMGEDGWVIPVHARQEKTFPYRLLTCGGSMLAVSVMQVPQAMTDRIEQHVVDAMPPRINDDWDTP